MEFIRQLVAGIVDAWQRLDLSARVVIVLAVLATVTVIALMAGLAGRQQFVPLADGLGDADSLEIQTYLAQQNIDYRSRRGGSVILVPRNELSQIRVDLAAQGLPKYQGDLPGYEIFDQVDLRANQFLNDVNLKRAAEGKLTRFLNEFEFVGSSWVELREADTEFFRSEQQPSKAVVNLKLTAPPTAEQVKAVVHVVSSFGGPNLTKNHITVTTTEGEVLHAPQESGFASIANTKLEFAVERERERERRIEEAFRAMGYRAIANVSCAIDFSATTRKETKMDEGIAVSTYSSDVTTSQAEARPEGAPGVSANIVEGGEPGQLTFTETVTESIENVEPSVIETTSVSEGGDVKAWTVAVMLEGPYEEATDEEGNPVLDAGGNPERSYTGFTDEQIQNFKVFVARTVGVEVELDDVFIEHMAFADRMPAVSMAAVGRTGVMPALFSQETLSLGLKILAVAAALLLVRRFLKRAIIVPVEEEAAETTPEMQRDMREAQRRTGVAKDVEEISREHPDSVASVLRTWMSEEE